MAALDYNATVSQRLEIASGLIILRVVPDQLPYPFRAGQYTVLGLKASAPPVAQGARWPAGPNDGWRDTEDGAASTNGDKLLRRAYSIASSSRGEEFLEFYLGLVPSGELTPKLFRLQVQDRLYVGPKAAGMFTLARVPQDRHIILVATGTGLAPYISMLRSEIECGAARKVVVLHGASCSWELAYRSELMALTRRCPNVSYLPVVSRGREDATWQGLTGHLQDVLLSGEVERQTGVVLDPARTHVFLCGNPNMIEAAKARLVAERGYVRDHGREIGTLHLEEYW